MATTIKRGENVIVTLPLYAIDGTTPVVVDDLQGCTAKITQYGRTLATYVYLPTPDPVQDEIRVGASTHHLEIEITEELSDTFKEGSVYCKLYLRKTDSEFNVDAELRDIDEVHILTVTQ
jgi:hypothetical protein